MHLPAEIKRAGRAQRLSHLPPARPWSSVSHAPTPASEARTQPTSAADLNAASSASPSWDNTAPARAVAISPPVRETALLKPDAVPMCRSSTADKTAVVNGATAPDIPTAITMIAGNTPRK